MSSLGIKGIPNCTHGSRPFCRLYVVANKSTIAKINRESMRINDFATFFRTLAIDIRELVNTPSIGNFSYVFGSSCFKSSYIMAYLLVSKSDVTMVLRSILLRIQLIGYKFHIIRIDIDSMFMGRDFQAVCTEFTYLLKEECHIEIINLA